MLAMRNSTPGQELHARKSRLLVVIRVILNFQMNEVTFNSHATKGSKVFLLFSTTDATIHCTRALSFRSCPLHECDDAYRVNKSHKSKH
jgi:hypothetical protein